MAEKMKEKEEREEGKEESSAQQAPRRAEAPGRVGVWGRQPQPSPNHQAEKMTESVTPSASAPLTRIPARSRGFQPAYEDSHHAYEDHQFRSLTKILYTPPKWANKAKNRKQPDEPENDDEEPVMRSVENGEGSSADGDGDDGQ
ncbi:hypothetical protein GGX14DRAFT_392857 [Mycena pura]|uniref:Uncharacterized protein n=1 Tax=Mycena pura TaxID=153505 RepID=A0AAD6VJU2_9AGAR|nr:hypothetical protein GGX14DRAFT_392857 [Mycena pura]